MNRLLLNKKPIKIKYVAPGVPHSQSIASKKENKD